VISRDRGHIDLKVTLWIMGFFACLAVVNYYEYVTKKSFWSLLDPLWIGAAVAVVLLLVGGMALIAHKPVRVVQVDGRTLVRFDGREFEAGGEPPEVERWTSGGAFGQPLEEWIRLKRGDEVLYEGRARDGERLLAALTQQPLAGGDAAKV
jgi:hypothetical protein